MIPGTMYKASEWVHCGSPRCTVCQILIVMPMVSAITRISSVREIVPLEGAFQQEVNSPQLNHRLTPLKAPPLASHCPSRCTLNSGITANDQRS